MQEKRDNFPLCVDLDGTLIYEDTTWLSVKKFVKSTPLRYLFLLAWLLKGRAYLKQKLATYVTLEKHEWTIDPIVLNFINKEKAQGRTVYLVTATDEKVARQVAETLSCFEGILASNGHINLRADAKAQALIDRFGNRKFSYIGNSQDDFKVWDHSYKVLVAPSASPSVKKEAQKRYKDVLILG